MTIILVVIACVVCCFVALAFHAIHKMDYTMNKLARQRLQTLNDKSTDISSLALKMGIDKDIIDITIEKIRWIININDFPIYLEDKIEDTYYIDDEYLESLIEDLKNELRISDVDTTQDDAFNIITIYDLLNYLNNLRIISRSHNGSKGEFKRKEECLVC